jgi:hypothetical protein
MRKSVSDLGVAAYLKMHGYKCSGKKSRNFYFDIKQDESNKFDSLCIEYLNSICHSFDAELMSMKKLPDYLPAELEV